MHRFTTCLLFVIALAPGCLPTKQSTTQVRRSALVPPATPINRSGQTMGDSLVEAGFGVDSMETGDPTTDDDDTGVAIPSHVLRGGIRFRFPNVKAFDIGLSHFRFSSDGATSVSDLSVPRGGGDGTSLTLHTSVPLGEDGFTVGFAADVSSYSLPYLVFTNCVSNCGGAPRPGVNAHRARIPGIGFAIIPNARLALSAMLTIPLARETW